MVARHDSRPGVGIEDYLRVIVVIRRCATREAHLVVSMDKNISRLC